MRNHVQINRYSSGSFHAVYKTHYHTISIELSKRPRQSYRDMDGMLMVSFPPDGAAYGVNLFYTDEVLAGSGIHYPYCRAEKVVESLVMKIAPRLRAEHRTSYKLWGIFHNFIKSCFSEPQKPCMTCAHRMLRAAGSSCIGLNWKKASKGVLCS